MVVGFANCELLDVSDFESKKGTRCGVIRWFDRVEHGVYRSMCFGDDVDKLRGFRKGDVVDLLFVVTANRSDDTIGLRLDSISVSEV